MAKYPGMFIREWRGARVVEGTGLENRQGRKSFVGSNPTLSAKIHVKSNTYDLFILLRIFVRTFRRCAATRPLRQ